MKTRFVALLAATAVSGSIGFLAASPSEAAQASPGTRQAAAAPVAATDPTSVPMTGTATDATFSGVMNITKFVNDNGDLLATGTLTGTLTDTGAGTSQPVTQAVSIPVTQAVGSCQVLDLVLGPLDLDLLGLVVHLNQVHLNITAEAGAGNLLGNLLCAVTNLLNGGVALGAIATLLNQILAILAGL